MTRLLLVSLALGALLQTRDAQACGGFYCSQVPVLQTSERVVFEIDGDTITAYVQLQYQGDDPNFAWIVPVPEVPEVEVGVGQQMFAILEAETKPIFVHTATGAATAPLADASFNSLGCGGFDFGKPTMLLQYVPVPNVDVLANEQVGPYDVVTISAESAEDLNNWLRANGYRVAQGSDGIVQTYLDAGMKLLALKLAPEAGSTAIEPIKLTYHDSRGCAAIPVKLTAIAAVPGLEIVTWVFGESRAGPTNYAPVHVPTDSLFTAEDYAPALAAAVDASGGRGFVTEYAAKTEALLAYGDPVVESLIARHGYVTRLRTFLDPAEMTADPELDVDVGGGDVGREVELRTPMQMSTGVFVLLVLAVVAIKRRRS